MLPLLLEAYHARDLTIAIPQLAEFAKSTWHMRGAACSRIHLDSLPNRAFMLISWQWGR